MKKIASLFVILLMLTSCIANKAPVTSNSSLGGVDGDVIPPSFAQFPDIPFPEQTLMDLSESKVLGSGDAWMGSIVFAAPYNASAMFDFYMSEMPKFEWKQIAVVRSKISHMVYSRKDRVVQILIEATTTSSKVTLTVSPSAS